MRWAALFFSRHQNIPNWSARKFAPASNPTKRGVVSSKKRGGRARRVANSANAAVMILGNTGYIFPLLFTSFAGCRYVTRSNLQWFNKATTDSSPTSDQLGELLALAGLSGDQSQPQAFNEWGAGTLFRVKVGSSQAIRTNVKCGQEIVKLGKFLDALRLDF